MGTGRSASTFLFHSSVQNHPKGTACTPNRGWATATPKGRSAAVHCRIVTVSRYVDVLAEKHLLTVGIRVSPLRSPATTMAEPWWPWIRMSSWKGP
ncbi:hypothetical protein GQ457_05G023140 [Hibiscus cannabinus]